MLTTNEILNLDDYVFKSSPESCSGNSCSTDYTDFPSDEDFLQQLSSDLDIPLLLNPGEDEMSLLNSFFDKSPDEIMSETAWPSLQNDVLESAKHVNGFQHLESLKLHSEVKSEPTTDSCSSSASNKSNSPVQSPGESVNFFEVKDEMKNEPQSPLSNMSLHTEVESNNILIPIVPRNQLKMTQNKSTKASNKRVPIQPKNPYNGVKNKVVLINNQDFKLTTSNVMNPSPPKVVVLENVSTVPITTVGQITPCTITSPVTNKCNIPPVILKRSSSLPLNVTNIDPKILKRQQRKIKNRESACLSRKKKKDYLTSLENQVKELTNENQKLKLQNKQLTERLMQYEENNVQKPSSNMKTNIMLCMFLFSVAFNFDYIRSPFNIKSQVNVIGPNTPKVIDHHGRNLLWADDVVENNRSKFSPFSMCPAAINQTESARLVLELERWIGKPKNLPEKKPPVNVTKLSVDYKSKSLRKRKQKKYTVPVVPSMYSVSKKLHVESNKELQVFSPTTEHLYSEFFEAINRQDDTFYVVSFSDHHMLLPALHHNKTRRPKMSLIMPSMLSNGNITQPAVVPLMQIDCEVLDTRLIQVRYGSIPQHLRRHDNSSTYRNTDDVSKASESGTNYTHRKAYKPYFIKQKAVRTEESDFYNIR